MTEELETLATNAVKKALRIADGNFEWARLVLEQCSFVTDFDFSLRLTMENDTWLAGMWLMEHGGLYTPSDKIELVINRLACATVYMAALELFEELEQAEKAIKQ